jgi:hypothetical protein
MATAKESSVTRAIGWAGLIAGTLDILDALIVTWVRGVAPVRVLYSIASGVLGETARAGGFLVAALGLALHFFIAYSVSTVFILASRQMPLLVRRAAPMSMLYGILVMLVMQFVVLPLAGFQGGLRWGIGLLNLTAAHLFCVGLPIGLVTRRFFAQEVAGTVPSSASRR